MVRDVASFRLSWRVAFPIWWTYWLLVIACFKLIQFLIPSLIPLAASDIFVADSTLLLAVILAWLPLTIVGLKFILETFWGDLVTPESDTPEQARDEARIDEPSRPKSAYGQLLWARVVRIWFSFMWRLVLIGLCVFRMLCLVTNP